MCACMSVRPHVCCCRPPAPTSAMQCLHTVVLRWWRSTRRDKLLFGLPCAWQGHPQLALPFPAHLATYVVSRLLCLKPCRPLLLVLPPL